MRQDEGARRYFHPAVKPGLGMPVRGWPEPLGAASPASRISATARPPASSAFATTVRPDDAPHNSEVLCFCPFEPYA